MGTLLVSCPTSKPKSSGAPIVPKGSRPYPSVGLPAPAEPRHPGGEERPADRSALAVAASGGQPTAAYSNPPPTGATATPRWSALDVTGWPTCSAAGVSGWALQRGAIQSDAALRQSTEGRQMAAATLNVGVLLAILEAAPEIRVQFRVDSHHSSKLGGKSQGGRRDRNQPYRESPQRECITLDRTP